MTGDATTPTMVPIDTNGFCERCGRPLDGAEDWIKWNVEILDGGPPRLGAPLAFTCPACQTADETVEGLVNTSAFEQAAEN